MTQSEMTRVAMALAGLFVIYKFVPHQAAKAAALGVAGVIVAKQTPVLKDVV